ncbi:dihydrolipoamide acetyltransferase family protein [Moheibacter lacus]|uniref:Dihydrolipoamide acetyltransferase component of pyruvate dehydrogenase complex n=1 Tax=Moheibacter lacus TaxID=2745851 RepID=A0A838ZSY4_9FLAO|nr:dihydrolipoamide acetyltransferase family protein [Moheibacter lacus]MBA5630082.1 2-oxo acid dehydrogenase subunit E2 [Moheibacter lacus]
MKEIQILLPKMGESVMEATITDWLKQPGDKIAKDELFVTIGTDKVDSDLPSEYEGILKEILVGEGEEVKVGHPIAILEVSADTVVHAEKVEIKSTEINSINSSVELLETKSLDGKSFLSPVVRRIAAENRLEVEDLKKITPTGENGRIRKVDILKFLKKDEKPIPQKVSTKLNLNIQPEDTVETLPRIRQIAAEHLQTSYQIIPHVTTFSEVNVTNLVNYREKIKDEFQQENGLKLTYTHFIMKAVIDTLVEFPKFNSWMNEDELILKKDINLGFATALPDGNLIVPNVKKVNEMSLKEIIESVNLVGNNAKSNKLKSADIQDTTFTVSNTGIFGSLMGTPIISRPQVAVLALGEIRSGAGVVVVDGKEELAVCKMMMLSLSYDHRVIDGALASQFLSTLKKRLENLI